jgi:hypothetical protein
MDGVAWVGGWFGGSLVMVAKDGWDGWREGIAAPLPPTHRPNPSPFPPNRQTNRQTTS